MDTGIGTSQRLWYDRCDTTIATEVSEKTRRKRSENFKAMVGISDTTYLGSDNGLEVEVKYAQTCSV